MSEIIALDADGVLLDYHAAYAQAYWPIDRWDVRALEGSQLVHFRAQFDREFWSTIPAMEGAVEACCSLVERGYELVCVSAIESKYEIARLDNLKMHGFPIYRVVATSSEVQSESPKARALRELNAVVFVDDFAPYLAGVAKKIHKALILRESIGSPNVGENLKLADTTHNDLLAFSDWWLNEGSH
ncbi:HAD family hydrolase [Undibacterium sp. Di24W]|uniref:HAD family hydrolase n=1 Tax=Undibacterium sp. Di24W TaxID=3413033 RepID=UPI003BF3B6A8